MRTHLYFIQSGDDGPVKIGKSTDPERRLATLQTGSHEPLSFLAVHDGAGRWERWLHVALREWRVRDRGEWFLPEVAEVAHRLTLPRSQGAAARAQAMASIGVAVMGLGDGPDMPKEAWDTDVYADRIEALLGVSIVLHDVAGALRGEMQRRYLLDETRRALLRSVGMATDLTMTTEQAVALLRERGEAA